MGKSYKDLTGRVFGRLLVRSFKDWYTFSSGQRRSVWECSCVCGNVVNVMGGNLTSGHTGSCGCLSNESSRDRATSHGKSNTPEYSPYMGMISRCFDVNSKSFGAYGGRGITVCDRWLEPEGVGLFNFISDMGEKQEGMSLDRIDVNGNYEPNNCRWTTNTVQVFNQRLRKDNKSGVSGVSWNKSLNKWESFIHKDVKKHTLGYFEDYEKAVYYRKGAEIKLYGESKLKN